MWKRSELWLGHSLSLWGLGFVRSEYNRLFLSSKTLSCWLRDGGAWPSSTIKNLPAGIIKGVNLISLDDYVLY